MLYIQFVQFISLSSNSSHKIFGQINKYWNTLVTESKQNFPLAANSTSAKWVVQKKLWTYKHVEKYVASDSIHGSVHMKTFFQDKFARINFFLSLFTKDIVNTDNVKECNLRRENFPICNIPTRTPDRRSY